MADLVEISLDQGSEDWRLARVGSLGASSLHEAVAKTKTGWGASRANIMARLVVERLTGIPQDTYMNDAMRWGKECEPEARAAYSFHCGVDVAQVGLVRHPTIKGSHCSPDGFTEDDGLVEFKCPNSSTHIDFLLTGSIPDKYVVQMLWQMTCTDRQYCDFVSYDPRLPVELRLFIKRLDRDNKRIAKLEEDVREFIAELEDKIGALRALSEQKEAA